MNLKVSRMDHLNMEVESLERAITFYQTVFGFSVKEQGIAHYTKRPYAIIGLSDVVMLCLYETGHAIQQAGVSHFGLHVTNHPEAVAFLQKHRVFIEYGGAVQQGGSKSIYISDPDGYEIELTEKVGGGL